MDSQMTNNLNVLYAKVQHIKEHSNIPVEVVHIGDANNILYFTIFINHEPFAYFFTKEAFYFAAYLQSSVYEKFSFQYYIQQNSADEYTISGQSDYANLQDATFAELKKYKPKSYTYKELLDLLHWEFQSQNEKLQKIILKIANEYVETNKAICDFLTRIKNKVGTDPNYNYIDKKISFSFLQSDEDEFHRLFFKNGRQFQQVCRYCTLETLFQMLSNQTIRMYSLAGMNDKSEYKYARDCFFSEKQPIEDTEDCINRTYVLSCSSMEQKDSLEMWRLYGDDGKGVCLIFDVDKQKNPLLLAKTIYEFSREGGRKTTDNRWRLLKHLTTELNNIGMPLKLRNQNKWLPLFKSGDYYYEHEVRLLYDENDESNDSHASHDWVLNNANSIFTPYVQFDLLDKNKQQQIIFPLKLKGIILGPKCPEKETNIKQMKNMLRRDASLKRLDIDIQVSEITNYR